MTARTVLGTLALIFAGLVPTSASADTIRPEVVWPVGSAANPTMVQIEGGPRLWGTRRVAAYIDNQVEGLRIFRTKTCADRPNAVCVRVVAKKYGNTGWWGEATNLGDPDYREIHLNATYGRMQTVACHELLHALGLDHHAKWGCLTSTPRYPSTNEIAALRRYYDTEVTP